MWERLNKEEKLERRNIERKKEMTKKLKEDISKWQVVVLSDFSGMNINEMEDVRGALKENDCSFHVMGNTIIKRALKDTKFEQLVDEISGPNVVAYTKNNPVSLIQTLVKKSRVHKNLKIKTGIVEKRLLSQDEIKRISTLPPREVLTAQLLAVFNAPLSNFISVSNGVLLKFIYVLKACQDKRQSHLLATAEDSCQDKRQSHLLATAESDCQDKKS
jgi:large subunit ribosomal protein L10